MSSYLRKPKNFVIHCPHCAWVNIYFDSDQAKLPIKERARRGLNAHGRIDHKNGVLGDSVIAQLESACDMIGFAQSLRPLMR